MAADSTTDHLFLVGRIQFRLVLRGAGWRLDRVVAIIVHLAFTFERRSIYRFLLSGDN